MIGRFHLRNVTWVIFTASANFNSRIRSSNFTRCIPSYQKIHGFSVSPSKSQKQQQNTKNQRSLPSPCFAPPPLPDPPLGRGWRRRVWCSWSPAIEEWIHRKRIPKRITEPTWTNKFDLSKLSMIPDSLLSVDRCILIILLPLGIVPRHLLNL